MTSLRRRSSQGSGEGPEPPGMSRNVLPRETFPAYTALGLHENSAENNKLDLRRADCLFILRK